MSLCKLNLNQVYHKRWWVYCELAQLGHYGAESLCLNGTTGGELREIWEKIIIDICV